jgi:hypothetical protein
MINSNSNSNSNSFPAKAGPTVAVGATFRDKRAAF